MYYAVHQIRFAAKYGEQYDNPDHHRFDETYEYDSDDVIHLVPQIIVVGIVACLTPALALAGSNVIARSHLFASAWDSHVCRVHPIIFHPLAALRASA